MTDRIIDYDHNAITKLEGRVRVLTAKLQSERDRNINLRKALRLAHAHISVWAAVAVISMIVLNHVARTFDSLPQKSLNCSAAENKVVRGSYAYCNKTDWDHDITGESVLRRFQYTFIPKDIP